MEKVYWNDVTSFCEKLTEQESTAGRLPAGMAYQLPTEAQWEYASRAGRDTKWFFGDDPSKIGDYAWFKDNAGAKSHPVEEKKPNPWGGYDIYGNVWEWCADWYGTYPTGAVSDPVGPAGGSARVHRGGSWSSTAYGARSAIRRGFGPAFSTIDLGFRLSLRPASK